MVGKRVSHPVLDHIGFLFEDGEASSSVVVVVTHLNLQRSRLPHQVHVVWLHPQCILEALSCLEEILSLLVDGAAGVPTEEALHLALHQSQLSYLQRLHLLVERQQEQRLQGKCLGMVRMRLQQPLCVLEALLVVLGVVVFLGDGGGTASCL
jgi:hypothetical protein